MKKRSKKPAKKNFLTLIKAGMTNRTFHVSFFIVVSLCVLITVIGILYNGSGDVIKAADAGWTTLANGIGYIVGNVGIANNNPTTLLDVGKNDYSGPAYIRANSAANKAAGIVLADAGTNVWFLNKANDGSQDLRLNSKSANVITVKQSGSVGFGTNAPARELHIYSSSGAQIKLEGASNGAWEGVEWKSPAFQGYSGMNDQNGYFFVDMGSNGNDLTILQNGNVGIGTSNPSADLQVTGNENIFARADGTFLPGDSVTLNLGDANNNIYIKYGSPTSYGAYNGLIFRTNNYAGSWVEKIGINKNGALTSPNNGDVALQTPTGSWASAADQVVLDFGDANNNIFVKWGQPMSFGAYNGFIFRAKSGSGFNQVAAISNTGNVTANGKMIALGGFECASDSRLKKDIKPVQNALSKIRQLSGVSFFWDREKFPGLALAKGPQLGLIAQDVEQVAPELVSMDKEGYKVMNYNGVTALLVNAIKEQQNQIDQLIAENRELRRLIEK